MAACTFDPLNKGPNATLSGGNKTCAVSQVNVAVGTAGYSDYVRHFEVLYSANAGAPQVPIVGVSLAVVALTSYLGNTAAGWGYYAQNGNVEHAAGSTAYGAAYASPPKVIGVTVNPILGTLQFWLDGVSQGTYAHASLIGAVLFPAVSCGSTGGNTVTMTLRCTEAEFTHPIPTGAIAWDAPAPDNARATIVDSRLAGIRAFANVSSTRFVASCDHRITMLAYVVVVNGRKVVGSLKTTYQPGQIASLAAGLFVIGSDGYLHKLSAADTPVEAESVNTHADQPWLVTNGNVIVVSGGRGKIEAYSTGLDLTGSLACPLSQITAAVSDNADNLYFFDGLGHGIKVTMDVSGGLTYVSMFTVPNGVSLVSAHILGSNIVLGSSEKASVILINTSTFAVTRTKYPGAKLNGVLNDAGHTPLLEKNNTLLDTRDDLPLTAGLVLDQTILLGSGRASRVCTDQE